MSPVTAMKVRCAVIILRHATSKLSAAPTIPRTARETPVQKPSGAPACGAHPLPTSFRCFKCRTASTRLQVTLERTAPARSRADRISGYSEIKSQRPRAVMPRATFRFLIHENFRQAVRSWTRAGNPGARLGSDSLKDQIVAVFHAFQSRGAIPGGNRGGNPPGAHRPRPPPCFTDHRAEINAKHAEIAHIPGPQPRPSSPKPPDDPGPNTSNVLSRKFFSAGMKP